MTKEQIEIFLTDLNYDFEVPIKLSEVSSIYLRTDNAIYPSEDTRFVFTSEGDSSLLLMYRGYVDNDTFVNYKNYPDEIISFDTIVGFTMVGDTHQYEPFKITKAV